MHLRLATHQQVWRYNLQLATSMSYAMTSGDEGTRASALAQAATFPQNEEMSVASALQRLMSTSCQPYQMYGGNLFSASMQNPQSNLFAGKLLTEKKTAPVNNLQQVLLASNNEDLKMRTQHRTLQQKFQPY
ncbi:hypothetical protein Ciccas_010218 [Cichlidogyrus casuarinus]|uniref:Uncharacterized protein n=1 Tax=Cichlidogyrus casuarinus TaxID=1844966 RepID=A0ABD2PUS1_9PLAT